MHKHDDSYYIRRHNQWTHEIHDCTLANLGNNNQLIWLLNNEKKL